MKRERIRLIIVVMSVALSGIILLQAYWIRHDFKLKEQQFEQSVNQAMLAVVDRLETSEAADLLHQKLYKLFPDSVSNELFGTSDTSYTHAGRSIPVSGANSKGGIPKSELSSDGTSNPASTELSRTDAGKSFVSIKRRNVVKEDSTTRQTISAAQITRIYGDSAEVILRLDEEKVKARFSKLNEVMRKMAVEYAGNDEDVRIRLKNARLDSLIGIELKNKGVYRDFDYGVWNEPTSSLLLSNKKLPDPRLKSSTFRTMLFPNDLVSRSDYLILHFPGTVVYLLEKMSLLLVASALLTFIVVFGFGFTISSLLKQKKLSDIKSDFINNMTHEFKTPIATISLAVDSLRSPKVASDPEKADYFMRIIREENKRMNSQVERVLQMAQIDQGELKLKQEKVDMHDLIENAIRQISIQVENRHGVISSSLEAEDPTLTGDPVHLSNLIFNLLDNANKYSIEKPDINVITRSDRYGIFLAVKDKGIGMNKETQKKIFEPFYRVPTGNVHDIKGFGLGLSYVKAIIDGHQGHIRVESEPGAGSTFECFLPHQPIKA
ncbi:MAG: sensor histidine kinase [Bacteroidota bacterium]